MPKTMAQSGLLISQKMGGGRESCAAKATFAILPSGESGERAFRGNILPCVASVRLCPCPMVRFGAASFHFLAGWQPKRGRTRSPHPKYG
ncbi:hypothetical protein JOD24_000828 [Kroppenstedtia sanguinis]